MERYHLTAKSANAKTGPIPVSTSTASTCPPACPLLGNGCYAGGGPLGMHWQKVTNGSRGTSWGEFCADIAALPAGTFWRHNQAGDLPGLGNRIDGAKLAGLVAANAGKRGFTYTHKPMTVAANRKAVADANMAGFTINLSGNNLDHADSLADYAIAPVVVVLPSDQTSNTVTPKGRKVIVCPATQRDDVTCASCQMCQRQRDVIVGFPAHGASKRKASSIAKGN